VCKGVGGLIWAWEQCVVHWTWDLEQMLLTRQ